MEDNRHWRFAIRTLVCVGLLLPIIAAALYVSDEDTPLVIDGSPIVAEGLRGSDVVLEILVLNRGEDTVRVVGAEELCLVTGCAKEAPNLPMEIKGHQSKVVRVVYRIGWKDEPPYVLTFYTNCASQPELTVTIWNKCIG